MQFLFRSNTKVKKMCFSLLNAEFADTNSNISSNILSLFTLITTSGRDTILLLHERQNSSQKNTCKTIGLHTKT